MSEIPETVRVIFTRENSGDDWALWGAYLTKREARDAERDLKGSGLQLKRREYLAPPSRPALAEFRVGTTHSFQLSEWSEPARLTIRARDNTSFELSLSSIDNPNGRKTHGGGVSRWTRRIFEAAYRRAQEYAG